MRKHDPEEEDIQMTEDAGVIGKSYSCSSLENFEEEVENIDSSVCMSQTPFEQVQRDLSLGSEDKAVEKDSLDSPSLKSGTSEQIETSR